MQLRLAKLMFIGGLLVWITNAVLWCASGVPLGHDEAQYATEARELVEGKPQRYIYAPIGMAVLGAPGALAGGDEAALRVIPMIASVLFLLAAWRVSRRVVGDVPAQWIVGVLATAHPLLMFSAQLLGDLPSTACLLVALCVLLRELSHDDGPSYRLVAVAPLCAAAFYIRYGSCLTIALLAVAAVAFGWRAIAKRPLPVIVTCLAFVALLLPHAVYAMRSTGSPIGILTLTGSITAKSGPALADYFLDNPCVRYGVLVAPVMIAGALVLCRARVFIVLQGLAIAQIVVLGLTAIPQTRYVFFAMVLLVVVGVDTLRRGVARAGGRTRTWLAATAALLVVLAWIGGLVQGAIVRERRVGFSIPFELATHAIRADAAGAPCEVTARPPAQLEWYTGCRLSVTIRVEHRVAGRRIYAMRTDGTDLGGTTIFWAPGIVRVFRVAP